MGAVWKIGLGLVGGLVVAWLVLVVALVAAGRRYGGTTLRDLLRLLPDLLRLLRRLAADPTLPRGVRVRLWLLLAYLLLPIDLVPDFVPGATDTRVKRRIFDDSTSPSFATFVSNVPSAGTFRGEVETYIKSLEALAGNVT